MTDTVVITIITMTILSTLGFILKKVNVTDKRTDKFISVLLVNYITPALLVHTALTQLSISFFRDNYLNIILAIGSILAVNFVGILVAKLLKLKGLDRGQFLAMASFSNVIFIGIPMITGIFGSQAIPYLMLYYVANTVTFWTLGIYQLSKSTGRGMDAKSILKVFNPPIVGVILAFILLWKGVSLPNYVMNSLGYLKDLTTPLSLIFMGSTIGDLSFKNIGSPVTTVTILLLRFLISPVIILIMLRTFSINSELGKVFIVCSGLPVMTNTALAVERYGGNPSYASFMTALSSILFIFVMPFYTQLFTFL